MPGATYAIPGFLGGEISQFYQGRFDHPSYKNSLNVSLNGFPVEAGAWVRRPGSMHAGMTRGGAKGRTLKFDFSQAVPYTVEYTDGFLRFRSGAVLATNNDAQSVNAISTANPAVVTVPAAPASGATVVFNNSAPALLQNRQFTWTNISGTTGSIADALTGAGIDGSTLGAFGTGVTMSSIQEVASPYAGGLWGTLRMVQAQETGICLQASVAPQALTVTTDPTATSSAIFALNPAVFNDGPYLDPFTNGVLATPNAVSGIVTISLSFATYSSTTAYAKGDFVTSSSVNYESLVDQNVGNTPASSPSDWAAVSAGAAINNGQGFLQTDIGRLVRFLSEPAAWLVGSTYSAGAVVTYNPTGAPGAGTYWQSLVGSNTGNVPGADVTHWELVAPGSSLPSIAGVAQSPAAAAGPAQWTWGKITSLTNFIPGAPTGIVHIGNMTGGGGNAAAFDGNIAKNAAASASISGGPADSFSSFVGQNYSGCSTTAYAASSGTIFPSTDKGLAYITAPLFNSFGPGVNASATLQLYGSNTAPSNGTNGTLLGQTTINQNLSNAASPVVCFVSPIVITSSDLTDTWKFLWVNISISLNVNFGSISIQASQVEFVSATTASTSNGINVEIIGPPLLYETPIQTWRLGAFSGTTGYPTCGCYAGGRLWLGGAIANRFDASVSGGVNGGTLNFAPTDQYGGVNDNSAIDYTLDAEGQNQIQWMRPIVQNQALRGIVMGTLAAEQFIFAPGNSALSPINIDDIPATHIGSANVLPLQTEHTVIFVQRYSVKLMEYFSDVFSGKFTAPNLADKAQHITRAGIAELAYTHSATPIIWGRDNNGALFGCTYKRDTLMTSSGPTFYAWHRHALGSGRIVESLCEGPSVGGTLDALTMVTNNASAATPVRHVEILTDVLDELSTPAQAAYLDDAIVPTSNSSSNSAQSGAPYGGLTLNGLWPHNGKTVTAWLGGLDCGDYTVANGSIFVPYGDGIGGNKGAGTANGLFTAQFVSTGITANGITMFTGTMPMVVGFTYNSDGQIVRPIAPQETGARNGPALGKTRRNHYLIPLVQGVSGAGGLAGNYPLLLGTKFDGTLKPAQFKVPNTGNVGIDVQFSGVYRDQFTSDYDFDGMSCWRVTRPYICNIPALGAALETQDI